MTWLLFAAGRGRLTWWAPAGAVLGGLVLLVPWVGWRVTYYGWFVPNVTAVRAPAPPFDQLGAGWEYLTGFVVSHQAFLLLGVAAIAAIVHRRKDGEAADGEARAALWLLFTVALVYLVAVTLRGGDPQPAWRLLAGVPVLFSVGAVAAYGARLLSQGVPSPRPRSRVRVVASVTVVVSGLSLLVSTNQERMLPAVRDWSARTAELAEMGSWLGERLPAGSVVSTYVNGALAYHAGIRIAVVDVRGRTDEHIARDGERAEQSPDRLVASDYDYVVNVRRPAVAVAAEGYDGRQHCAADPAYAGRYNVATFQREGSTRWATLYLRREQVAGLVAALDADPRFTYVPCPL